MNQQVHDTKADALHAVILECLVSKGFSLDHVASIEDGIASIIEGVLSPVTLRLEVEAELRRDLRGTINASRIKPLAAPASFANGMTSELWATAKSHAYRDKTGPKIDDSLLDGIMTLLVSNR